MVTNLLVNVKVALEGMPVTGFNGCLDSTVALFWINRSGQYKQFVENRVQKIHAQPKITLRHVPTWQNPVDLASRGGDVEFQELLWHDPEWMSDSKYWSVQQVIQACGASRAEIKVQRDTTDRPDGVFEKFKLSKAINICAWISRFLCNSCHSDQKLSGPLTTKEIRRQHIFWVKRMLKSCDCQDDYLWRDLQPNQKGTLDSHGRIQGMDPIYLQDKHLYIQKLVHCEHRCTPVHPPWGSKINNDKCEKSALGLNPKEAS